MSTQTAIYDVFLSYSVTDRSVATAIATALGDSGMAVFWDSESQPADSLQDVTWKALAESKVVIAVVGQGRPLASSVAVEIGAAMAWQKKIFVVNAGANNMDFPNYLASYQIYPMARIDDLVQAVRVSIEPQAGIDPDALVESYRSLGISTDRLLTEPSSIVRLARNYNSKVHASVSGEHLIQELIRLRKRGSLPRIKRG